MPYKLYLRTDNESSRLNQKAKPTACDLYENMSGWKNKIIDLQYTTETGIQGECMLFSQASEKQLLAITANSEKQHAFHQVSRFTAKHLSSQAVVPVGLSTATS